MIVLGYIGDHKKDTLSVRLGWWLIRLVQTGEYKRITHMEAVLAGDNYKSCQIASASLRDDGVRKKQITPDAPLNKKHWQAFDVPDRDAVLAAQWFRWNDDEPYNWVGAISTKIPLLRRLALMLAGLFCNWAVLQSMQIENGHKETPSQSMERLVRDYGAKPITNQFFKD